MPLASTIAVIFDFDDTLGEDTTTLLLKEILGMSDKQVSDFWNIEVDKLVKKGWDPPLAYLSLILKKARDEKGVKMNNHVLRELGRKVQLYPGVDTVFDRLRRYVESEDLLKQADTKLEFYIISGGFEEILRGTSIAKEMKDIFACTIDDDNCADPSIKSTVTFTEKTKFLYAINKGVTGEELRRDPYRVNDVIPEENRRIPFRNMIYIGDGPTDIPCFSAVQHGGGRTIGLLKYQLRENTLVDNRREWAIARGDRRTLGPYRPCYGDDDDLYLNLKLQISHIGFTIYDTYIRSMSVRA
jgi:phosphoserine phosphatase